MKNRFLMKTRTKWLVVLLVCILLLSLSGCQKTYTFEELRPYYEEIHTAWVNKEYRGVVNFYIEAVEAGREIGFIMVVEMNEENSYAKETTQKLKERYGDILKIKSDSLKKNTADKLKPYLEEIDEDIENGKYPALKTSGGGVFNVDINNDKAEETAKNLKEKYGDKVIVSICSIIIAQ